MNCDQCPWYDPDYGCDAPDFALCDCGWAKLDDEYDGDAIFL